jgi:hypothetical protein
MMFLRGQRALNGTHGATWRIAEQPIMESNGVLIINGHVRRPNT